MIIFTRSFQLFSVLLLVFLLQACASIKANVSNPLILSESSRIVVGPIANNSDTPLANRQVESMTIALLQAKGFKHLLPYKRKQSCEKLLYCPDESYTRDELIRWGRQNHVQYILTGATNEWRYKVGLDGEPVAGVSLFILHVNSGRTIWSAVGSAIGGSRQGLDVIGQKLLIRLLQSISAKEISSTTISTK